MADVTNDGTLQVGAALTVASLDVTGTTTVNGSLTSMGGVNNRAGSVLNLNGDMSSFGLFQADGTAVVTGDNTLAVAGLTGSGSFQIGREANWIS